MGPVKAIRVVRACVRAAGKGLEEDDRQTNDLSVIARYLLDVLVDK